MVQGIKNYPFENLALDNKYKIDSKELYDIESKVKESTFTY